MIFLGAFRGKASHVIILYPNVPSYATFFWRKMPVNRPLEANFATSTSSVVKNGNWPIRLRSGQALIGFVSLDCQVRLISIIIYQLRAYVYLALSQIGFVFHDSLCELPLFRIFVQHEEQ
jgi:hypothetical protein